MTNWGQFVSEIHSYDGSQCLNGTSYISELELPPTDSIQLFSFSASVLYQSFITTDLKKHTVLWFVSAV